MNLEQRPEAIIITLSQQTIKDRRGGYKQILTEWANSDGNNGMWYYKCGNAPKHEVTIIYWVVGGRIRWQSTLVTIHRNQTMRFSHRTKPMYAKSWFELIDFQPIPRHLQPVMQGFQGFRYSQKLF